MESRRDSAIPKWRAQYHFHGEPDVAARGYEQFHRPAQCGPRGASEVSRVTRGQFRSEPRYHVQPQGLDRSGPMELWQWPKNLRKSASVYLSERGYFGHQAYARERT